MSWYLALGIKIFMGITVLFQAIFATVSVMEGYIKGDSWKSFLGIMTILLLSITIPFACWAFNL